MLLVSIYKYIRYFYALYKLVNDKDIYKCEAKDTAICIDIKQNTDKDKTIDKDIIKNKNVIRLKNAIYKCGPMGIKLMQFIIMYDELLPKNIHEIFNFALEDCKQHSWEETCLLYYQNFNKDINEDFIIKDDDKIAIGSGSIGQVYKLYNKKLDQYVAVKVRHPNIDNDIIEFTNVINFILGLSGRIFVLPYYYIIKQYKDNIIIQNNFEIEAKNTIQLRENFKHEKNIIVPEVFSYNKDIIIMSYHEGVCIDKINNNKLKFAISNDINFILLSSIMIYDFTHADLHNGNWKVQIDGDKYNIIIYDCGLIATTNSLKLNKEIMLAIMVADYNKYIDILEEIYIPELKESPNIIKNKMKNLHKYIDDVVANDKIIPYERVSVLIKYSINNDIIRDKRIITLLISIILIRGIHSLGLDRNQRFFGTSPKKNDIALIFCTYIGLLSRMKKYEELKLFIIDYIDSDVKNKEIFRNWLYENLGHKDEDVFYDIIAKINGIENKLITH